MQASDCGPQLQELIRERQKDWPEQAKKEFPANYVQDPEQLARHIRRMKRQGVSKDKAMDVDDPATAILLPASLPAPELPRLAMPAGDADARREAVAPLSVHAPVAIPNRSELRARLRGPAPPALQPNRRGVMGKWIVNGEDDEGSNSMPVAVVAPLGPRPSIVAAAGRLAPPNAAAVQPPRKTNIRLSFHDGETQRPSSALAVRPATAAVVKTPTLRAVAGKAPPAAAPASSASSDASSSDSDSDTGSDSGTSSEPAGIRQTRHTGLRGTGSSPVQRAEDRVRRQNAFMDAASAKPRNNGRRAQPATPTRQVMSPVTKARIGEANGAGSESADEAATMFPASSGPRNAKRGRTSPVDAQGVDDDGPRGRRTVVSKGITAVDPDTTVKPSKPEYQSPGAKLDPELLKNRSHLGRGVLADKSFSHNFMGNPNRAAELLTFDEINEPMRTRNKPLSLPANCL